MRRAFAAMALGGLLLTASTTAACSSEAEPTTAAPRATAPSTEATIAGPNYTENTKLVCGKVTTIFSDDFNGFHTEMGKMIARKEAKETTEADAAEKAAKAQLKSIGDKVEKETAGAEDPALVKAGAASAEKLTESASDDRFFDGIKTVKDLDSKIEAKLTDWMNPVGGFCAT